MIKVHIYLSVALQNANREMILDVPQGTTVADIRDMLISNGYLGVETQIKVPNCGILTPSLLYFINGKNVNYLNGMDTFVNDGDRINIIPLMLGG